MRSAPSPAAVQVACAAVCSAVADIGFGLDWRVRLRAAELLIAELTQAPVEVRVVRAVAYGRSAVLRLGGALLPESEAELVQFRQQVGPAMVMLGSDQQTHAVLVVGGSVLVELASWNDYDDPGVLIRPFVHTLAADAGPQFVVSDPRTGASVAYEFVAGGPGLAALNRTYEQLARRLAYGAAARVRWLLDSPSTRKERTA